MNVLVRSWAIPYQYCTQVKAAFRELARQYHPDKQQACQRVDSGEKFKLIRLAYEILTNIEQRALFDSGEELSFGLSGGTVTEVDLGKPW